MSTPNRDCTRLYDTKVVLPKKLYAVSSTDFGVKLNTGYGMILFLEAFSFQPGASVRVTVTTKISESATGDERVVLDLLSVGTIEKIALDLHDIVDFKVEVFGDAVEFLFGFTVIKGDSESKQALPSSRPVKYSTPFLLNGGSQDLRVDGSGGANIEFIHAPGVGQTLFVQKVVFELRDDGALKLDQFGSLPGLTNGVLAEVRSVGNIVTSTTIKNNGDFISAADIIFALDQFQGSSILVYNVLFAQNITLFGDKGDFIKLTIRDDLTSLEAFQAAVKFWEVI